ncbi:MAG TPA: energy-coupling factor ABC transporter permease [Coriobacteriia bacterium]
MADALVSPGVGAAAWAATAVTTAYCAKRIRKENDPAKIPLMGVMGAFIFAAQMLNFTIPGTGSSGHLGGGLILAILLGPEAAFLTIASVLTVQALFFADGGLLALGSNIFNLGVFPAFIAYPVFKRIVGDRWTTGRVTIASILCGEAALLLGALGVVGETTLSGISALPFSTFVVLMLPIHAAIGLVEGVATSAVVLFVRKAQPEILARNAERRSLAGLDLKRVLAGLLIVTVISGAALAWFASADPDGLEWSLTKVTGGGRLAGAVSAGVKDSLAALQGKTAFLPGYGRQGAAGEAGGTGPAWPAAKAGTSVAGLVGAALTLALAALAGVAVGVGRRKRARAPR